VLGRLLLSGSISKSEVISGEPVDVTFTVMDQDEEPVNFSTVNVTVADKIYVAEYSGGGKYTIVLNTSEIPEGSYILRASATKDMYLSAECSLPLIVRPWWWPYLPYSAIASVAVISMVGYAVYRSRRKREKIIVIGSEDLLKVLKGANERLNEGNYAEAVKYSAETLRGRLLDKFSLSKSLTIDELVAKAVELRKDMDPEKLRYVLMKGQECTFARYKPNKEEAEKVLKYSEELLSEL